MIGLTIKKCNLNGLNYTNIRSACKTPPQILTEITEADFECPDFQLPSHKWNWQVPCHYGKIGKNLNALNSVQVFHKL
jgi:hypothetical protein